MARGQKTPDETVAKFRAEYLRLGNASEAARRVGLPVATGQDYAREANEDSDFVKLRSELYAGALDEVESLMLDCIRVAAERVNEKPLTEREQAQLMADFDLKSFNRQDIRAQYLAQIVNAHRSLQARKKFEAERSQDPGKLTINIQAYPPKDETDGVSGPDTESASE